MRALIQRVTEASVTIDQSVYSQISKGLLILVGIESADTLEDIEWMVKKITLMRIFEDQDEKMNNSILDIQGEVLVVSQFTLHASTKKGNRPSFIKAAHPDVAIPLYEKFVNECASTVTTKTGVFGANMKVALVNDGPVTIWLDSKNRE
jgi:D-tyrosyl-tRNA(Tyr) deacylase